MQNSSQLTVRKESKNAELFTAHCEEGKSKPKPYTDKCISVYGHAYMCPYMHACMCAYVCACMCACVCAHTKHTHLNQSKHLNQINQKK